MNLSNQQRDLLRAIVGVWLDGCQRSFVAMPTGAGSLVLLYGQQNHPNVEVDADREDLLELAENGLVHIEELGSGSWRGKVRPAGLALVEANFIVEPKDDDPRQPVHIVSYVAGDNRGNLQASAGDGNTMQQTVNDPAAIAALVDQLADVLRATLEGGERDEAIADVEELREAATAEESERALSRAKRIGQRLIDGLDIVNTAKSRAEALAILARIVWSLGVFAAAGVE